MNHLRRGILWILLLIVATITGTAAGSKNQTILERDGWNLISVCADMNRSEIDMSGIEEIQSQNGLTIYTGEYANLSNLNTLYAGYGYWVKGQAGISFDSGESRNKLVQPLTRDGWNLMASCEDIPKSEIDMSGIGEIQSQNGETIYTGEYAELSNLDNLRRGYGYWVKGSEGTLFTSQRGLSIPSGFDYQTINNTGATVEGNYEGYLVKVFANYSETANDQANHTALDITVNGTSIPVLQIQGTYRGHEIVVAVYDVSGKLVAVSDNVLIGSSASVTSIALTIENPYGNGGGTDSSSNESFIRAIPFYSDNAILDVLIKGNIGDRLVIDDVETDYVFTDDSIMEIPLENNSSKFYELQLKNNNGELSTKENIHTSSSLYGHIESTLSEKSLSVHREGSYANYYTFTIENEVSLAIDLNSSFDTYLFLLEGNGRNGRIISENDDYNDHLNSHISITLSPGVYTIEVTSFDNNTEGVVDLILSSALDSFSEIRGKTYYLPYVDENGTKIIRELTFDNNLSTITWQDVLGGSDSGISVLRFDDKSLILDGEMYFSMDLDTGENQPLNIYINRYSYNGEESSFKEGSFKLFSSQDEVYSYLGNLLSGQTLYVPSLEENKILEVYFNENMTQIRLDEFESNIVVFGDRLYIGENEVLTLRYAYSDSFYFDYEGLDENNQTVYRQMPMYVDEANAQQELDYYNSQPHIYLSETNVNINSGEDRNISYISQNVDSVRLESAPDFISLDESNQSIVINTANLNYSQSYYVNVVGINNETGSETWESLYINITIDPIVRLQNKLGGNTYYMPYVDNNGTKIIRELSFDNNLSTLTWQDIEGYSKSGTSKLTFNGDSLILDDKMSMYIDFDVDESQPLNIYFYRNEESNSSAIDKRSLIIAKSSKINNNRDVIVGFLEGSFKLFSSEERLNNYLSDILAGNTYFVPNFRENRIDEILFNEEFTTITRATTENFVAFGNRLYIDNNETMILGYAFSNQIDLYSESLDENNQTVYNSIEMYLDRESAEQALEFYNSESHLDLSEYHVKINAGEIKTISYTSLNLESIHIESDLEYITIDTDNQTITIDATNVTDAQQNYVQVIGESADGYSFDTGFDINIIVDEDS